MLGHQLWKSLRKRHDVWVTVRRNVRHYHNRGILDESKTLEFGSAGDLARLVQIFSIVKPDWVVNCIGIVKQRDESKQRLLSLQVNSIFPHQLAQLSSTRGARMVHVSTDCVFKGDHGPYQEADTADAVDLYGQTKSLGEVLDQECCLTLRTSIIGHELDSARGLIEWFLSQKGETIKGFRQCLYSGLTTIELSRVIEMVLLNRSGNYGLWQVSSDPITKYDLLLKAKAAYSWEGEILPDDNFKCDRRLVSDRFREEFEYKPPSWDEMLVELANSRQTGIGSDLRF